jgi:hypothetical protein
MPRPKKFGIRYVKTERANKIKKGSHKIERNPSKDRAMHEGGNPLF